MLTAGAALAAPVTYRLVAGDGSPGAFAGRVQRAFAAWTGVRSTTLEVAPAENAALAFAWGDGGIPMNPDLSTRTLVTETAGATTGVEVRVNPEAADVDSALIAEVGLRLGLAVDASIAGKRAVGEPEAALLRAKFSPTGDLNGDGRVDLDDLSLLAANYGKSAREGDPPLTGDLNGDGTVNDGDLEVLRASYTFDAPPAAPAAPGTAPASPAPATPAAQPGTTPAASPVTPPTAPPATPPAAPPATPPAAPVTPPTETPVTPPSTAPEAPPPANPGG